MAIFYFDASALAKRYSDECGTHAVNSIFENIPTAQLVCLVIGVAEIVSVLVRKRNDGRISSQLATQSLVNLYDEVIDNPDFTLVSADDLIVINSIEFIVRHSINSTDAIVLATALEIRSEIERHGNRLILVSSDQRLNRVAQHEGLTLFNPEDQQFTPAVLTQIVN